MVEETELLLDDKVSPDQAEKDIGEFLTFEKQPDPVVPMSELQWEWVIFKNKQFLNKKFL